MSDLDPTDEYDPPPDEDDDDPRSPRERRTPSWLYPAVSAVLALVSVAAAVLIGITWWNHRDDLNERDHQDDVRKTAAEWAQQLINIRADDSDAAFGRLRDKTTGQLHIDFDTTMQHYRANLARRHASSVGRVESVALETLGSDLAQVPGAPPTTKATPPANASRTDTVLIVATSVIEVPNEKPSASQLQFQLDVSEVDGKLLISRWGLYA